MIAALIEAALRAVLVALAAGVLLHLFRVNNVLAQKAAWGLVLAASVAMPLLMRWQWLPASVTLRLPAPASRLARESSPAEAAAPVTAPAGGKPLTSQAQFSVAAEPVPTSGDRFPAPTVSKQEFDAPVSMRSAQAQPESAPSLGKFANPQAGLLLLQPTTLAVFLYLAVLAALLLRMMYGLASAIRLWLAAQPCAPETGIDSGTDPARGLRLRSSPALSSQVTIGSGVVLPADYPEWDAEKLRIVLAHERSHVRQGDFYLQMLAGLYAAVFWFSPLGWWLKRKLSDLGEAISDRAGLEEAQSRTSYAQVLLAFAALPRPTVIGVAMARSSNLSHRIERLLNESSFRQAFAGSRGRVLLAVLLVPVALFAGTAMIRVQAAGSGRAVEPLQSSPTAPA